MLAPFPDRPVTLAFASAWCAGKVTAPRHSIPSALKSYFCIPLCAMILYAPTPLFQSLSVRCLQPRVVCGCQLGPRAGNKHPLPYGRCSSPVTRRFILAAGSSIATTAAALGLICSGAMAMAASGGGRADKEGAYKATRRGMQLFVEVFAVGRGKQGCKKIAHGCSADCLLLTGRVTWKGRSSNSTKPWSSTHRKSPVSATLP